MSGGRKGLEGELGARGGGLEELGGMGGRSQGKREGEVAGRSRGEVLPAPKHDILANVPLTTVH